MNDWEEHAACKGRPDVMYPVAARGHSPHWGTARKLCSSCPVRRQCLALAMEHCEFDHDGGVWGGLTPEERQALRRQRVAF